MVYACEKSPKYGSNRFWPIPILWNTCVCIIYIYMLCIELLRSYLMVYYIHIYSIIIYIQKNPQDYIQLGLCILQSWRNTHKKCGCNLQPFVGWVADIYLGYIYTHNFASSWRISKKHFPFPVMETLGLYTGNRINNKSGSIFQTMSSM